MTSSGSFRTARRALSAALLATSLLAGPRPWPATTATIRGSVTASAAPPRRNCHRPQRRHRLDRECHQGSDGSVSGLRPGTYDISSPPAGGGTPQPNVIVSVGQTAT